MLSVKDLPVEIHAGPFTHIAEKSAILLFGPENSGKTQIALEMARLPVEWLDSRLPPEDPVSVLVVSFRTTERRFHQSITANHQLHGWWSRLKYRHTRWYSPGENVGPEQVVADVWGYIKESRRQGIPLQRIVFDELESAEHVLPLLKIEHLFWATLLQLVNTEAVTSIFVVGGDDGQSQAFRELKLGVDYIVRAERRREDNFPRLELLKKPDLMRSQSLKAMPADEPQY